MYSAITRATLLSLVLCASPLAAQSDSGRAPGYLPLSGSERWHDYVHSVIGPLALISPVVTAGIGTIGGTPNFWDKNPGGFGQRLGTAFVARTANETVKASLSALLHEDNTYYQCTCRNVFARTGHALLTSVLAKNDNGHSTLAMGRITGAYAEGLTTTAFYQHEYGINGAFRLGTTALTTHAVTNIVREFVGPIF